MSKVSSDENIGDANSRGKMFNLNQSISRGFPVSGSDGGANMLFSNGVMRDSTANENKPEKIAFKVGGVTHTIQTKSSSNGASSGGSLTNIDQSSNIGRVRQNHVIKENSYHDHSTSLDKKSSLRGIPWKDFSRGGFNLGKEDINRMPAKNTFEKQGEKLVPVRKRAPKRRDLDEEFDEDDDAEIQYLKKLKNAKVGGYKDLETESTKYKPSLPRVSKKSNSERAVEETDYEEDELLSDGEPEGKKKKKQKDLSDIQTDSKMEMNLTTRQRALLYSKDAFSSGVSQIEFPDGLLPQPRKQKEELSEVEQQTKKAEAAQKRKIQNEKAARELEAEAIRKILSQDSSRKKKEDKIKKRLEELAQEKVANAKTLASNTIRWTMQSTGTIVTFPQDMGLPKIFDSKPHRSFFPIAQERFMSVISQLFQYRIIHCGGAVDDDMADIIVAQLLYLDAVDPTKDIVMYVNSPGGSVTAGMAVFDTMRHIRPDVSTVCVGLAASMGAFLLSTGTKGKRYSLPNSRLMIHQSLGGAQGGQSDIDIQANEMLHHKTNLNGYLAYHTGQSLEKTNQDTDRDFFMSAKEGKDYGLIDGVILNPLKALQPLAAA